MSDQVIFLRDHASPMTEAEQHLSQAGDSATAVATVLEAHVEGLRSTASRLAASSMAWSTDSHREAEMAQHCRRMAGRGLVRRLLVELQSDVAAVQSLPTVPRPGGRDDNPA